MLKGKSGQHSEISFSSTQFGVGEAEIKSKNRQFCNLPPKTQPDLRAREALLPKCRVMKAMIGDLKATFFQRILWKGAHAFPREQPVAPGSESPKARLKAQLPEPATS